MWSGLWILAPLLMVGSCGFAAPAPSAPITIAPSPAKADPAPIWGKLPPPRAPWYLQTETVDGTINLYPQPSRKACEAAAARKRRKTGYLDPSHIAPTPAPDNIVTAECLPI